MAGIGGAFDASKHDDMQSGFDLIPLGKYLSTVTKSDVKKTKDKKGKYISLTFTIQYGKYKGRLIFTNMNIINANPVAVQIAHKELATLCRAVGKASIQDTTELHGIPFVLDVGLEKDKKGVHPDKNKPVMYEKAGASPPPEAETMNKEGAVKIGGSTKPPVDTTPPEIEGDFGDDDPEAPEEDPIGTEAPEEVYDTEEPVVDGPDDADGDAW
jgi:hypothetical protein